MSYHCIQRAKERAGLPKAAAEKIFVKAYMKGLRPENLPAKERNYMTEKSRNGEQVTLYGEFLYIFADNGDCITMYHVPSWFMKKSKFSGKTEIRNTKKYFTRYCADALLS